MCLKSGCSTRPTDVVTHVCPKLVPFFKTLIIYFVLWLPLEFPSVFSAIVKCLPIICLIFFVYAQGVSLHKDHDYQRRVLIGLIFSCLGDALLIWHESHFITAMAAFAIAHVAYIRAFGFYQIKWKKGFPFIALTPLIYYLFYPGLQGFLLPAVYIYILVIFGMGWRAIASVDILENEWSWTSLCGCMGAVSFMVSDFVIGFNKFVTPVPYDRVLVMTSYYLAQALIAVSAVNTNDLIIKIRMSNRPLTSNNLHTN